MQDEKGKRGNERKQTLAGNQLAGGRTSSLYFGRRQSDHSGQGGNSATCAGTCEPVQGGAEGVGRAYRGTRWDRHFSCGKLEIWKGGIKHERKRNGGETAAPEKIVETGVLPLWEFCANIATSQNQKLSLLRPARYTILVMFNI